MRRRVVLTFLLGAALALAGCGANGGDDDQEGALANATPSAAVTTPEADEGAATSSGDVDACALLPEDVAAELLGGPVVRTDAPDGFASSGAVPVHCVWTLQSDDLATLGLLVAMVGDADTGADSVIAALDDPAAAEELEGLGERALLIPGPVSLVIMFGDGLQYTLSGMEANGIDDAALLRAAEAVEARR